MSDAGDDRKGSPDASSITPKKDVTGRSSRRNSNKSRRSMSSTSTPMKTLLEQERQNASDKVGKFFSNQTISDRVSGTLGYKVTATVKINGITYQVGEVVPLETVEPWSKTSDSGEPTPDKDSDAEDYRDSGDPDDTSSNTYPSPLIKNNPYWCWSEENENLIKDAINPRFVVPTRIIFTPAVVNAGSISYQAVKEKFIHSSTNPFKFHKMSFAAVREIQDAVIAHIRKTIRADQEYSLFDTFKDELRKDVVIRLRTHKEYAAIPGNSHRRDGMYLENDINGKALTIITI